MNALTPQFRSVFVADILSFCDAHQTRKAKEKAEEKRRRKIADDTKKTLREKDESSAQV